MPIKSTATKTRLGLVVKTFVFHSNVSQRLGLPRLSQRFNVQLVQLHGGISVFFFFFFLSPITNNTVDFKGRTGQLGKITFTLNKTSLDESFSAHVSFSSYR